MPQESAVNGFHSVCLSEALTPASPTCSIFLINRNPPLNTDHALGGGYHHQLLAEENTEIHGTINTSPISYLLALLVVVSVVTGCTPPRDKSSGPYYRMLDDGHCFRLLHYTSTPRRSILLLHLDLGVRPRRRRRTSEVY